jgi:hypothetical protein
MLTISLPSSANLSDQWLLPVAICSICPGWLQSKVTGTGAAVGLNGGLLLTAQQGVNYLTGTGRCDIGKASTTTRRPYAVCLRVADRGGAGEFDGVKLKNLPGGAALTGPTMSRMPCGSCRPGKAQPPPGKTRHTYFSNGCTSRQWSAICWRVQTHTRSCCCT